jgi:hypothetical protein
MQVHSFRNQVRFTSATQTIPQGAVVVEIGPHAILRSAIRQTRPDLTYIPVMRKGDCGLATLATALSDLWRKGVAMQWNCNPVPSGTKRNEGETLFLVIADNKCFYQRLACVAQRPKSWWYDVISQWLPSVLLPQISSMHILLSTADLPEHRIYWGGQRRIAHRHQCPAINLVI